MAAPDVISACSSIGYGAGLRFLAHAGEGEPGFLSGVEGKRNFVIEPFGGERCPPDAAWSRETTRGSVDDAGGLVGKGPARGSVFAGAAAVVRQRHLHHDRQNDLRNESSHYASEFRLASQTDEHTYSRHVASVADWDAGRD